MGGTVKRFNRPGALATALDERPRPLSAPGRWQRPPTLQSAAQRVLRATFSDQTALSTAIKSHKNHSSKMKTCF